MSTAEINTIKANNPVAGSAQRAPQAGDALGYDVAENDEGFSVRVSLPGVGRDGVDIAYEDETLRITGTRGKVAAAGWRPLHRELPDSDYRLHLRLNVDVDAEKILARIEDGILELSLPKAEAVKPRKIKVS